MLIWGLVFPQSLLSKEKEEKEKDAFAEMLEWQKQFEVQRQRQQMEAYMRGVMPEEGSAKYGLRCIVPESYPSVPYTVCPKDPADANPAMRGEIRRIKQMAERAMEDYETQGNVASENIDSGMQGTRHAGCLNEELERLKRDVLDSRLKRLDDLLGKLDDDHEKFLRKNQKNEQSIKDAYNQMYLGKGIDYKARFQKASCKNIYPADEFQKMTTGKGLEGILDTTADNRKNSETFLRDSRSIKQDIKNSINRAAQKAGNMGLLEFKNGEFGSDFKIGSDIVKTSSFNDGIVDLQSRVKEYFGKVDRQLQSVLDHKGTDAGIYNALMGKGDDLGSRENLEQSFQAWKNYREQKCFYDTFQGGKSTIDKALDSLNIIDRRTTQTIRSTEAVNLSNYIKNILKNEGMGIAAKANKIQKYLDNNPKLKVYKVVLGSGFRGKDPSHQWTADELVNSIKNECFARMGEKTYGSKAGQSLKSAINKVTQIKNSIKRKQDNFQKEFANELAAKVLTCQQTTTGEAEIKRSCNAKSMVVEGDFCFRHANNCAKDTESCLGNLQKQFDRDKLTLQNRIKEHNESLRTLAQSQYNLYKQLRKITEIEAGALQGQFSQANFEPPKGLDIKLPKEQDSMKDLEGLKEKLGLGIIDPQEFKKEMETKLGELRNSIKKQNDLAYKQAKDYVDKTIASFSQAKTKWEQIYAQCKAADDFFKQAETATGENENPPVPLCDASNKFDKSIAESSHQYIGIAKTLEGSGILENTEVGLVEKPGSIKNISQVERELAHLKTKIVELENRDYTKKDKDDDGNTITVNNTASEIERAIQTSCEAINNIDGYDLTCSGLQTRSDLIRKIEGQLQGDTDKVFKELADNENKDKVCPNQDSGQRFGGDNKFQTPPFNTQDSGSWWKRALGF